MNDSRTYATQLLKLYYKTFPYPYTHHQINSYDQLLSTDIPAIIKANNPILILQDPIGSSGQYSYKTEIYVGGLDGSRLYVGTPSVELKTTSTVRILYPNEARLRNLTYASTVSVDIVIRVTFTSSSGTTVVLLDPKDPKYAYLEKVPLFQIPIMLHSKYCLLNNKPNLFLKNIGECPYDYGGYFIIDGSEKVLITHQEQSFNTLYISKQPRDKKVEVYATMQCLNPISKEVKRVGFGYLRNSNVLRVSIPFVRKAIPIFVLFRALGVQSDKDILRLLCPDENDIEAKVLEPLLHESMLDAYPILDTYSAIQYIRVFTKGFSEAHVYDILYNQLFIHIENKPSNKAAYLADCVLKILRVKADYDTDTDKDDIRNQRCLTSGILTRILFQGVYTQWLKAMSRSLDQEYKYNPGIYSGSKFLDIFLPGNINTLFQLSFITEGLNRGFKGKWSSGAGVGEEKTGVLQPLSRLSYLDFLSHCRRVVLDFDTGMKLQGPRRLHTTQYGYFCTSETPGGGSIGITKNFSVLTAVSLSLDPRPFSAWLFKMGVYNVDDLTPLMMKVAVPVYINSGIVGYTIKPNQLVSVCKLLKHTGCLPAYCSVGFNIRERRVFFYFDEGRPVRPLVHIQNGVYPYEKIRNAKQWRDLVLGTFEATKTIELTSTVFTDPLNDSEYATFEEYTKLLSSHTGAIEYVDPYESNEAYIAMYPEEIVIETTHVEIHPSTMVGLLTSMIPFPNHNQSPRNQLSCSQSKQGISIFSTNYPTRYDNQTHVLCYGEAPLVRTLYYDYAADGNIGYGHNLILAMGCFTGYNQEDGIVMNADSIQRGLFRNITFRSYEVFEEDDDHAKTKTRVANPKSIPAWTRLKAGLDYRKLDERGIIKKGEYVDETTVLVARYIQSQSGEMNDASITAQVWTSGTVESVVITVNNMGHALVKIRVIHDRIPELGDKFSNRHGQKGTIGMLVPGRDMPRTASGIVPDMMMNPHAIPSRMTIAQLLESLLGKSACLAGFIGDATAFMNESGIEKSIGAVLQDQFGLQPYGEELFYDGTTGKMIPSTIFVGNVYTMRLKHMVEDKWNARGMGRREQRTHQPTGGRGNQGGLRIGEMERDALIGHGISNFLQESMMKRSDGSILTVCNGCGTVPITNPKEKISICSLCDGPLHYVGDSVSNLEPLPTIKRSTTSFSSIEIPYSLEILNKELGTYMNMYTRYLTTRDITHLRKTPLKGLEQAEIDELLNAALPTHVFKEMSEPEDLELPVVEKLQSVPVVEEETDLEVPVLSVAEAKAELDLPYIRGTMPIRNNSTNATANDSVIEFDELPSEIDQMQQISYQQPSVQLQMNQPELSYQQPSLQPQPSVQPQMNQTQMNQIQPSVQPQIYQPQMSQPQMSQLQMSQQQPSYQIQMNQPQMSQPQPTYQPQLSYQQPSVQPQMNQPQMNQPQPTYQPQTYQQAYRSDEPPTLVVDTSTDAMNADGFVPKSILKRPNSPSRFNKPKTSFTINKMDNTDAATSSVTPKTVNIIKTE